MIKKLLSAFTLLLTTTAVFAQYTTPNTGVNWGLDELMANAPDAIAFSGGIYTISQDITIAETDTFTIDESAIVHLDQGVLITVAGDFVANAPSIVFTASNTAQPFDGFRFESTSSAFFRNTSVTYGGGIRVLTGDFDMDNCIVSNNASIAATASAIQFSTGSPIVSNSQFRFNTAPAFSSGANQVVSSSLLNNILEANNQTNNNRPQINMGPGGADTLRIVGNTIIGAPNLTLVGGVAASALLGGTNRVIIDNNTISGNRYGITVIGGTSSGYIRGNILENNNTQNLPMSGGSGISLSASGAGMNIIATNNQIRGNLWGITVITQAGINLGNTDPDNFNPGGNVFANNGNGGQTYALYNNTPNTIYAMNNCWIEGEEPTAAEVESVISHQPDDAALGEVIYTPFGCDTAGTPDYALANPEVYPNPNNGTFSIKMLESGTVTLYNVSGQLVYEKYLAEGENMFQLSLPAGMYFLKGSSGKRNFNSKIVIK